MNGVLDAPAMAGAKCEVCLADQPNKQWKCNLKYPTSALWNAGLEVWNTLLNSLQPVARSIESPEQAAVWALKHGNIKWTSKTLSAWSRVWGTENKNEIEDKRTSNWASDWTRSSIFKVIWCFIWPKYLSLQPADVYVSGAESILSFDKDFSDVIEGNVQWLMLLPSLLKTSPLYISWIKSTLWFRQLLFNWEGVVRTQAATILMADIRETRL